MRLLCVIVALVLGNVVGSTAVLGASAPVSAAALGLFRGNIKYVFILYQENRSFDSYFGTFPGADGLYSLPPDKTPGFEQPVVDLDGSIHIIQPFRIGPAEFAADTADVDHAHSRILAKMDTIDGRARMDRFAIAEERKRSPIGAPTLKRSDTAS